MAVRDRPSTPRWVRVLVLAATSVAGFLWIAVAHPLEGRVVYDLGANHGIHRYDFLGVIPPLIALFWLMKRD